MGLGHGGGEESGSIKVTWVETLESAKGKDAHSESLGGSFRRTGCRRTKTLRVGHPASSHVVEYLTLRACITAIVYRRPARCRRSSADPTAEAPYSLDCGAFASHALSTGTANCQASPAGSPSLRLCLPHLVVWQGLGPLVGLESRYHCALRPFQKVQHCNGAMPKAAAAQHFNRVARSHLDRVRRVLKEDPHGRSDSAERLNASFPKDASLSSLYLVQCIDTYLTLTAQADTPLLSPIQKHHPTCGYPHSL